MTISLDLTWTRLFERYSQTRDVKYKTQAGAEWVLRRSKGMASVSFSRWARPARLFLRRRKKSLDPPMRQLVGVVGRRSGRRLIIQTTKP